MSQLYHAWLMLQLKDQTGHVFIYPASLKDASAKVSKHVVPDCCQLCKCPVSSRPHDAVVMAS